MFAKLLFIAILSVHAAQGTPVTGLSGVQVDTYGNGQVLFDSTCPVNPDFDYISYRNMNYKPGEKVYTICFMGDSGEPDDIIERLDFSEKDLLTR